MMTCDIIDVMTEHARVVFEVLVFEVIVVVVVVVLTCVTIFDACTKKYQCPNKTNTPKNTS